MRYASEEKYQPAKLRGCAGTAVAASSARMASRWRMICGSVTESDSLSTNSAERRTRMPGTASAAASTASTTSPQVPFQRASQGSDEA